VKSNEIVWAWITTKGGYGYGLICGGDVDIDAGTTMYDMCHSIADTFSID
jgi:hypothetical protein